jgi:lipopolysaccharide export system protein LptA
MNRKVLYLLLFTVFTFSLGLIQAQTLKLLSWDVLRMDNTLGAQVAEGNVRAFNEGIYINCDKAIFYKDRNELEAMGNVYIFQPDTFDLTGRKLFYNGTTKMARVTGDVVLKDKQMTLRTPALDYNTETKSGAYYSSGVVLSGDDKLTSKKGYYDSRSGMAYFKDNVVLTNPEYTMTGDTLQYNTNNSTAHFFGPTKIVSKENTIHCVKGWYNTKTDQASFTKGATIFGENSEIYADSFFYDKNTGIGKGFRNLTMKDTTEKITVYGNQGFFYRNEDYSIITGLPVAEKYMDEDTMYLLADTLIYYGDSLNKRLEAFHDAKIYTKDMTGKSDSLFYFMNDSLIEMRIDPVIWTETDQITGDTIRLRIRENKAEKMWVWYNSFLASHMEEDRYNQISGKQMEIIFEDNKVHRVNVEGNAASIYYSREDDTAGYIGINKVESGRMAIYMESGKVEQIRFYQSPGPSGKLYPPKKFPEDQKFLPNFNWKGEDKPRLIEFHYRKEKVLRV